MKTNLIFCGKLGSGKSTLSKIVAQRINAQWSSFGNSVKHISEERGLSTNREQLQELGAELVAKTPDFLCNRVLSDAGYSNDRLVVLDGLRHESILKLLRDKVSPDLLVCILVDVEEKIRFDRISKRSGQSVDEIRKLDKHSTELEVGCHLRSISDFVVDNSKSVESAVNAVIDWLAVIK